MYELIEKNTTENYIIVQMLQSYVVVYTNKLGNVKLPFQFNINLKSASLTEVITDDNFFFW